VAWEEMARSNTTMQSLPFAKVQHQVATLDAQPSNTTGGIMVLVTGALLVGISSGLERRLQC
jgi:hypothetical protein